MKRLLVAITGALVLVMLLSGSVFAAAPKVGKTGKTGAAPSVAASVATGQPAMDKDKDFGYYLWYDGSHFQLRATDRGNGPGPSEYTGKITAHGSKKDKAAITDVNLIKQEQDDSAIASGNKLDFRFKTYNAIDGVSFAAQGAKSVTFRLYRDGHLVSTDHIFIGGGEMNPPGNPFKVFVG
ncbi:MAG: hypothetical protein ACR2M3_03000 [Thermomicrobiales bacterium]